MTETWLPSEGDRILCVDNSYRIPDPNDPHAWPEVGEVGVVQSFWKSDTDRVIIILFTRGKNYFKEYFAISRGLHLHYEPMRKTIVRKNR